MKTLFAISVILAFTVAVPAGAVVQQVRPDRAISMTTPAPAFGHAIAGGPTATMVAKADVKKAKTKKADKKAAKKEKKVTKK